MVSGCSTDLKDAPGFLTKCVLDIDIYKNRPSVHEHIKLPNSEVRAEFVLRSGWSPLLCPACWFAPIHHMFQRVGRGIRSCWVFIYFVPELLRLCFWLLSCDPRCSRTHFLPGLEGNGDDRVRQRELAYVQV